MTSEDETETSDEQPIGPMPSGAWVRDHREKLIADAERRENDSLQDALSRMIARGEQLRAEFKLSVCGGEESGVARCDDANERTCDFARDSQCPKRILELRQGQRFMQRERLKNIGVNDQLVLDESPPDEPEEPLPDALVARYERIEAALQLVRDNVELPDPIHEIVREALKETE